MCTDDYLCQDCSRLNGLKSRLSHLLPMWLWKRSLTSLYLHFPVVSPGVVVRIKWANIIVKRLDNHVAQCYPSVTLVSILSLIIIIIIIIIMMFKSNSLLNCSSWNFLFEINLFQYGKSGGCWTYVGIGSSFGWNLEALSVCSLIEADFRTGQLR